MTDELTGCGDDQTFAGVSVDALRSAADKLSCRTPPTPAAEEREAVAQWCSGCHEVRSVDCYRAGCPKSDTERRAAEILAAEANERARIEADLKDPQIVHMNMLRGGIAKINVTQAMHLNGWTSIDNWHRMTVEQIEAAVTARAALTAPVPGDMREVVARLEAALTTIAGSHWERFGMDQTDIEDVPDLSAEEAMNVARDALSYDNDQAAALTPHIATDEREAVDAAFHKSWCAVIDLLDRDYITPAKLREAIVPFVAAEILAAEANERARIVTWLRSSAGPTVEADCYTVADMLERAALTANHSAPVVEE